VNAIWEPPGGLLARQREQPGLRTVYENLLTKLHDHFEAGPADPEPDADTETEPTDPDSGAHPGDAETDPK
jgi:hypothetical protein